MKVTANTPAANANKSEAGSGVNRFAVVPEGYYTAVVEAADQSRYTAGQKGLQGEFDYLKITPKFVLFNDEDNSPRKGTIINRQDWVLGAVNSDGALYRPDGDETRPALYSSAGFLLNALGFVKYEDGKRVVDIETFEPALVAGQVVRVHVKTATFEGKNGQGTKNEIAGVYGVREGDIKNYDLVTNDGEMYFFSQEKADAYIELKAELAYENDGNMPF